MADGECNVIKGGMYQDCETGETRNERRNIVDFKDAEQLFATTPSCLSTVTSWTRSWEY
jgi:hypothetical protein